VRLLLVLHPERRSSEDVAATVLTEAAARGIEVLAPERDAARVPGVEVWDESSLGEADVVVALGGDGTVLEGARIARKHGVPAVGVNAGTVGFLAEIDPDNVAEALDALVAGEYRVSERMTLEATLPDGSSVDGLNDAVVEKAVSRQVVRIEVAVAGEPLALYRTDAVIVSTPTGSTAYNFSAGGPLVDPELQALIVTAVAPHNLFGRSLVFGPAAGLELTVGADRSARLNVDGLHVAELEPGDTVHITRGRRTVRLIRFSPGNFARTVKEKFHLHDA
jgi:NAD+ kinase